MLWEKDLETSSFIGELMDYVEKGLNELANSKNL
jgi:hypothetical protein